MFSGEVYKIFVNLCFCIFIGSFIYNAWKRCSQLGVIGTLSNIYDGDVLQKQLTASSP